MRRSYYFLRLVDVSISRTVNRVGNLASRCFSCTPLLYTFLGASQLEQFGRADTRASSLLVFKEGLVYVSEHIANRSID